MALFEDPSLKINPSTSTIIGLIPLIPLLPVILPIVGAKKCIELGYERITGREGPSRKYARGYSNPEGKPRKFRHIACKDALKKEAPKPLPARRKRALTLPLPDCSKSDSKKNPQTTNQQEDSLLFSRFPLEIRRMIYAEVLTGDQYVIHIYRKADQRLSNHKCDHEHKDCRDINAAQFILQKDCWYYDEEPYHTASGAIKSTVEFKHQVHGLLPLLQTCRLVYVLYIPDPNDLADLSRYSEAIDMLYRDNTFSFPDPASMMFFSQTVLPQRLELLRSIHILWSYDPYKFYTKSDKKEMCKLHEVLKKMKQLETVEWHTLFIWPMDLLRIFNNGPIV